MTAAWHDYEPEAVAEWLEWLAEHPDGDEGLSDDEPPDDSPAAADEAPSEPPAAPRPLLPDVPQWRGYGTSTVFGAPFDDTPLLVPALDIGPGRPTGIWGAAGAGKSDAVQALALAVMAGRKAFGTFAIGHRPHGGRVVHLSYDMGLKAVTLRYRRLANGMGLAPGDVEGRLLLCVHPPVTLATKDATKAFRELLTGYDLAILDNARGATPGVDENDSQFGAYIAAYGAAAEATGCTPVYLHHTKKARDEGQDPSIDLARGSSSIVASSGCVWLISGSMAEPRRCVQLRCHDSSDGPRDEFTLHRVEASGGPFDVGAHPSWRLEARKAPPQGSDMGAKILRALGRTDSPMSETALRKACGTDNGDKASSGVFRAAVKALIAQNAIVETDGKYALP